MDDVTHCDHGVSLAVPCLDCEILEEIEEDAADEGADEDGVDPGDYEEGGEG